MLYQTHIRVHLDNICRNLENIRKLVGPACKILLAAKANAYGHGAAEVSLMAERDGLADWIGVSTVPEGIELRHAGLRRPILKFSPAFAEEMEAAVDHGITLAVCDPSNVEALQSVCTAKKVETCVHLKVDTGMGRMGVAASKAAGVARFIERNCPSIHLEGIFTHLAASDQAQGTAYTEAQISLFKKTINEIAASIGRTPDLLHCASSGGILGHKDSWMSMVRPGVLAYGHYPTESSPAVIAQYPGMSFLTRISHLKKVHKGTSIGYGRTWVAHEDTWIATIQVGFADGFNRLLSNHGRVLVDGKSYPVVGRICMDQSMINLGPETDVHVGDEVVLIGRSGDLEITTYEWARELNTVTSEITCQINSRVQRVFLPPR